MNLESNDKDNQIYDFFGLMSSFEDNISYYKRIINIIKKEKHTITEIHKKINEGEYEISYPTIHRTIKALNQYGIVDLNKKVRKNSKENFVSISDFGNEFILLYGEMREKIKEVLKK